MASSAETAAPGAGETSGTRNLLTPEGVPVRVRLADRGERAAALIIDLLIVFASIIGLGLACIFILSGAISGHATLAVFLLISFLIRSFYFIFFELHWEGRTPGKRVLGLRVIDRSGARLRADAIFARNLMREVEVFIPVSLLLSAGTLGVGGWGKLLTIVWISVLVLLPFFNRDRLRAGDIVGGTWVISMPKNVLSQDISDAPARTDDAAAVTDAGHRFTLSQLDAYGIYELQTLETALRNTGPSAEQLHAEIAARVAAKIRWPDVVPPEAARHFLTDYYTALRSHLEARALFGERRADKHDGAPPEQ